MSANDPPSDDTPRPRTNSTPDDFETILGQEKRAGEPTSPPVDTSPTPTSSAADDLGSDWVLRDCERVEYEGSARPVLGRNVLLSRIGAGGMAFVYSGVHPRLNRQVAVKIVDQGLLERHPEMAERFEREARLAAQLSSPHLVQVYDVDRDPASGLLFLVMEFVNGETAADWRKRYETVAESDALQIVVAATRGLVQVHACGIIHRDVKPENILIPADRDGGGRLDAAKLADLGIARPDGESGLTATSCGFGTPGFMSPEQATDASRVDKPADVFSMGATLYALLTGQTPYRGTTPMEVMLATLKGERESLEGLRGSVSDGTIALMERCLAPDPEDRYADATELLKGLEPLGRNGAAAAVAGAAASQSGAVEDLTADSDAEGGVAGAVGALDEPAPPLEPSTRSRRPGLPTIMLLVALLLGLGLTAGGVTGNILDVSNSNTYALIGLSLSAAALTALTLPALRNASRRARLAASAALIGAVACTVCMFLIISARQHANDRRFLDETQRLVADVSPIRALEILGERSARILLFRGSAVVANRLQSWEDDAYRERIVIPLLDALERRVDSVDVSSGLEPLIVSWGDAELAASALRAAHDPSEDREDQGVEEGPQSGGTTSNNFFSAEEVAAFERLCPALIAAGLTAKDAERTEVPNRVLAQIARLGSTSQASRSATDNELVVSIPKRVETLRELFLGKVTQWAALANSGVVERIAYSAHERDSVERIVAAFRDACRDAHADLGNGLEPDEIVEIVIKRLINACDAWRTAAPPDDLQLLSQIPTDLARLEELLTESEMARITSLGQLQSQIKRAGAQPPRAEEARALATLQAELAALRDAWHEGSFLVNPAGRSTDSLEAADERIAQHVKKRDAAWRDRVVPHLRVLAGSPDRATYEEDLERWGLVVEVLDRTLRRDALVRAYLTGNDNGGVHREEDGKRPHSARHHRSARYR